MQKKADKYTSGEIQNELLKIMGCQVQRAIIENAGFFTIMVDECVDTSNKEQLVICFRYVDSALQVHEDFVGLNLSSSQYHCQHHCRSNKGYLDEI